MTEVDIDIPAQADLDKISNLSTILYILLKRDKEQGHHPSQLTLEYIRIIFENVDILNEAFKLDECLSKDGFTIDKVLIGYVYCTLFEPGFEEAAKVLNSSLVKLIQKLANISMNKKTKSIIKPILICLLNPAICFIKDFSGDEIFPQLCRIICLMSCSEHKSLLRNITSVPTVGWSLSTTFEVPLGPNPTENHILRISSIENIEPRLDYYENLIKEVHDFSINQDNDERYSNAEDSDLDDYGDLISDDSEDESIYRFHHNCDPNLSTDKIILQHDHQLQFELDATDSSEQSYISTSVEKLNIISSSIKCKNQLGNSDSLTFKHEKSNCPTLDQLREHNKDQSTQLLYIISTFQLFFTLYTKKVVKELSKNNKKPTTHETSIAIKAPAFIQTIQCFHIIYMYNAKKDLVPISSFYNDQINEYIDIKEDFHQYKMMEAFCICTHSYLLNPYTKSEIVKMENSMTMRTELQDSFFHAMFSGVTCPYLVLEVRRDWLVRDTICQLQLKSPADLRKQLKVRFVGEEGIDEGGVQKEFFQLLIREMFDEKYGMFYANNESNSCWFVPEPNNDNMYMQEMRLVGMILGLAVYNSVILNIHFPNALYKKLLRVTPSLGDLKALDPTTYNSLVQILYSMSDEEIEMCDQTFEISYDHYDESQTYQLVADGPEKLLNSENKFEFVNSYVDFVFNKSCSNQFEVFRDGFLDIVGNSFVMNLAPVELELIVCGSSDLDFDVLDKATIYDGGYKRDTPVIKYFWDTVKSFSVEQKKKLLFFTTGSDRVPIGGLGKMKFVIVKNGVESDRLPTSHTCFNALLLPEYDNEAKLKERLLSAINNSEGFGMM